MPGLFGGLGNTFVPIYLGSSEVAYPRINNMSVLVIPLSYTLVLLSLNNEFGSGIGWTLYPPLSTSLMSLSPVGIDVIICGLLLSGISSTLTSLNFFVTIQNMRCYGMTLSNMSVYVWSIIITASMLLLVLPILTGALIMLIADLHYNTVFFDPLFGGDPVFYQHLFWFFGHPEVYILILPAFGLISMILSGLIQVIIFGNQSMILAMSCISILGSVVWSHHMFTVGMESDTRAYFTVVTMMISLPTGSKIFNWLCTYLGTNASLLQIRTSAVFFVLIFLLMFTIGGSTGVILGNGAVDIALHDTYYVVTHFHFILSLGTVIAIFSGIIFFLDQLLSFLGSLSSISSSISTISRYHLVVTFVGILLTFTPMHFLGFNVMPRRVLDYQDYLNSWNYLCSIGSSITLISFFILGTSYTGIYRHNSMISQYQ
jgi:cytochrome c oxidase subunit 1